MKHLKTDPANAPLEPADKAMIDFALKLTREPSSVKQQEIELLKQHGFGEEQVVDIVLITCTFNFMDRLADGLGVELDAQMQRLVERNADKG
ncbi:MAG: carboxymuconolactone decarboxylase family protein [Candidatus Binataceae bacterium]